MWWRRDAFEALDGGQFEWVDGRYWEKYDRHLQNGGDASAKMGGRWGGDAHMIPLTWVLLRAKGGENEAEKAGGGCVGSGSGSRSRGDVLDRRMLVCSTHIESGHDWNDDVPAKRRSAMCIRAAVGRLQEKFGADVPLIVAGDFNMQKVQFHHKLLTGEGVGIWGDLNLSNGGRGADSDGRAVPRTDPSLKAPACVVTKREPET